MIDELMQVKCQLLERYETDVPGLLKRVPFAPLLECRVYCSNDSERSHNISADYQLSVLLALDAAAAGEPCRMPLKELAGFAPKIHLQTMKVAMAAMVERDLVWESDERIGRERTARWDTIAALLDEACRENGLPFTYHTAYESATTARAELLGKHHLTSTRPIVANLCLRSGEDKNKLVGAETQREVLRILSSFEEDVCPLTLPQIADRLRQANGIPMNPRTIRRAMRLLVSRGHVWQSEKRQNSERFIRWDQLLTMIPARGTWRADNRYAKTIVEQVQSAKKRIVALRGTAEEVLSILDLRPASSGTTIVSSEVQRKLLAVIASHDRGCRFGAEQLASQIETSQRTVNHVLAVLLNERLIIETALGNNRLRFVDWDIVETLLPAPRPVDDTPHEKSDGQIVVSSWLPIAEEQDTHSFRQIFRTIIEPSLVKRSRSKATVDEVIRAIDAWELFWPPELHNVKTVRPRHLESFQENLLARGLSNSTVNNYLRSIQRVLIAAHRHGMIRRRPSVSKLPTKAAPRHYLRFSDVEAIWEACAKISWPAVPGLDSATWWRCALVLFWAYGFRTQELIAFTSERPSLDWSAISLEAETPNPEGTAVNPLGWLSYVPHKQKWSKPTPLYLPLTSHTRQAIDTLATANSSGIGRIFPWPQSSRDFYAAWKKLQAVAGVTKKAGGHFETKAIRRSAATYLEGHYRGLGAAVIGWADRDVSSVMSKHYAVTELLLVEKLADYVVPACFEQLKT